jgi:hypothetical protein
LRISTIRGSSNGHLDLHTRSRHGYINSACYSDFDLTSDHHNFNYRRCGHHNNTNSDVYFDINTDVASADTNGHCKLHGDSYCLCLPHCDSDVFTECCSANQHSLLSGDNDIIRTSGHANFNSCRSCRDNDADRNIRLNFDANPSSPSPHSYCQLYHDCNSIYFYHVDTDTSCADQYGLLRCNADSASADSHSVSRSNEYGRVLPYRYPNGYDNSSGTSYSSTCNAVLDENNTVNNNQCSVSEDHNNNS